MMKKLVLLVVILLCIFTATTVMTYPRVGQWLFETVASLESSIYGLSTQQQDVGDVSMSYYRGGKQGAPVIVMIHGYTSDRTVWARFAKYFTDDYDVIIPDLAGHGETPYDPSLSYTQQAQAERIAALLDRLGIEKVHLIGNSMGGYISAYFAIAYPERTLSAAMVDPAGVISPTPSEMDKLLAKGENAFEISSFEDFKNFYPMTMAQPPFLPKIVLDAKAEEYMQRRERYARIGNDIHTEPRLTDRLHKLQAPSLLIWGDQDRLIDVSAVAVWTREVPAMKVEVMKGYGHMPMVEAPAESASIYREFLGEL
ncbi:alpha/beta hydrolase [Spongiibacter sp. KMU-158]|uniref:Alpha/beta hydrolase n=1 Tax=Spongiibacter pelagi TaxID=2760804 RepID=A0A927GWJ3_9GAMM|nr:alpha/beta hydrolase [Spongiibacter pelagi]MBD2859520.1 alpha/beta hydrolase [Spongiibacter pelagi]